MQKQNLIDLRNSLSNLIVSKKELVKTYQNGYLGKKIYKVTYLDGTSKYCEQITKKGNAGDAVVIIPLTTDQKIVMILESRPNVSSLPLLEFPAGMIDDNEDPVISAKRELLEETGYDSQNIILFDSYYQDQGCSEAKINVYIANDCKKVSKQSLDEGERIEPLLLSYEDLLDIIESDDSLINDANTKLAALKYVLKRRDDKND